MIFFSNKRNIKQHDISDCGAACLASICNHYGLYFPIAKIRQYAGTDKCGTSILGITNAASKIGMISKGIRINSEMLMSIPLPAIAHLKLKNNYYHYVVVYEVSCKGLKIMDPIDGKIKLWSYESFESCWTNIMVLICCKADKVNIKRKNNIYGKLLQLICPYKNVMFLAILLAIIYSILGLGMSWYLGEITDYVLVEKKIELLNVLSIGVICVFMLKMFVGIVRSFITTKISQKTNKNLILEYYRHILKLPQSFYDTMRVGEIVSRINDATKISSFINETSINLIVNILTASFALSFMFAFSLRLSLVAVLFFPIYTMLYFIQNKSNKKYQRRIMEKNAELGTHLVESLNNILTIKHFALENHANIKTETKLTDLLKDGFNCIKNSIYINNSIDFFTSLITVLIFWYGSNLVLSNEMTIGSLVTFNSLLVYATTPIISIITSNHSIQDAFIAMDRLFQIMDLDIEKRNNNDVNITSDDIGDIDFKNVFFSYGNRKCIFNGLNLIIKKGEITAIVGESGSGKSSICALLQRLYDIESGSITIGGIDIASIDRACIRNIIVSVPQKIQLFAGSVISNIAIGDINPNIKKIDEIISLLKLDEFVKKLPNGLDTKIGENGINLSGGESQRIAIARALYRQPQILILDEATSSLDSISENIIKDVIRKKQKEGLTIIIIAHRLSTIKDAQNIIVLENGNVEEQGKHDSLLKNNKKYKQLWEYQN